MFSRSRSSSRSCGQCAKRKLATTFSRALENGKGRLGNSRRLCTPVLHLRAGGSIPIQQSRFRFHDFCLRIPPIIFSIEDAFGESASRVDIQVLEQLPDGTYATLLILSLSQFNKSSSHFSGVRHNSDRLRSRYSPGVIPYFFRKRR